MSPPRRSVIPPLPPIPTVRCKRCHRVRGTVMNTSLDICTRTKDDTTSHAALECELLGLKRDYEELQTRETALLHATEQRTIAAVSKLIEELKLTGLDQGMKQYIVKRLKANDWKKKLGS